MSPSEGLETGLALVPSAWVRFRSKACKALASLAVPRSMLFVHGDRRASRRRVALTFDDGPDEMTPAYLDALRELDVRATFFLLGEQAERRAATTLEYRRRGHEVGGHGWTHAPFPALKPARLAEELQRTRRVLPPGLRRRPLVRPPRGALTPGTLLRLVAAGYSTVLWSLDSDDCRTRDPSAIEDRLDPRRVAPGEVILLHEMQPWTLRALPAVVRRLRDAGYELATVGDLMAEGEGSGG